MLLVLDISLLHRTTSVKEYAVKNVTFSPGRVQSAALRLVCEREAAIEAFKPREYWTVEVTLSTATGGSFQARRLLHTC